MTNAKYSYPEILIDCADRTRKFCFNLAALMAIEKHMIEKTGNEKFSALRDFDWNNETASNLAILVWAGFSSDADTDKEPWTIAKAAAVVELVGLTAIKGVIVESLSRMLTPEQRKKIVQQTESPKKRGRKKKN